MPCPGVCQSLSQRTQPQKRPSGEGQTRERFTRWFCFTCQGESLCRRAEAARGSKAWWLQGSSTFPSPGMLEAQLSSSAQQLSPALRVGYSVPWAARAWQVLPKSPNAPAGPTTASRARSSVGVGQVCSANFNAINPGLEA